MKNSKVRQTLIDNTKHISVYEPYMKNIIINLDEAEKELEALMQRCTCHICKYHDKVRTLEKKK